MKVPPIKPDKPTQLVLQFPKRKPKQVQLTFRFPKTEGKKLDKLASENKNVRQHSRFNIKSRI